MPPKNSRSQKLEEEKRKEKEEAERLKRLEEERERNLKLIQEEARENALRKPIIEDSVAIFESLLKRVREQKKLLREEENWKKYLKCEKIPDTKIPSNARAFLYKFEYEFLDYYDKNINWWLKCDKNSIMTQDIRIADRRRQTVDASRVPTAKFYDQKLRFMMKVYESLEDTLRRKKVSSSRLEDLITIKSSFRETAFKFLDVHTLEILMSIDREMNSMTPLISHYVHSSPDFIKFIWSFKDVTLPKNRDKYRQITIQPLRMSVTMPSLLDLETTSVRILWFKRDFFTDYCPSYSPSSFDMKFENFDLAIDKEMKMRKHFQNKRLDEMRQAREAYEIKMEEKRLREEAEEANKKNNKNKQDSKPAKKTGKSKSVPVEPPKVDESTYVNVDEDYLEYENGIFEEERELWSSHNLNLELYDVNMREYQVIGGIYKIESLERPLQTKEIYQHLFVRLNDRPHILNYRDFHYVYEEPVLKNVKEERKTLFAEKILEAKNKALANLMKVEIKLSDKIIWWERPMACRWERWEDSVFFRDLDPELQDYNLNFEKYQEKEQQKLWKIPNTHYQHRLQVRDFQLTSHPDEVKLSTLIEYYLIPIMPLEYSYYVDRLEMFENMQREWRYYQERRIIDKLTKSDEEMRTASLETIEILDKFLKFFENKYSRPHELFPLKVKGKIDVWSNPEVKLSMKIARMDMQRIISKKEEYYPEFDDDIPINEEPLMLSELLERIKNIQESLMPIFKNIQKDLNEDDKIDKQQRQQRKSKKKKMSINPRVSSNLRKSTRKLSKKFKNSDSSKKESLVDESETATESSTNEKKLFLIPHHKGKWVTKDIYETSYDEETKTFTFYAGCCGTFGLVIRKYFNLPFKNWELYPVEDKNVIMRIDGQKMSIEFKVTSNGFTFEILKPGKTPMQQLRKAVKIFELKKILTSLNINLFPEMDAVWYVENISEKHNSMEFHTYKSMATFCLSHHFQYHELNRYGNRREIVLKSKLFQKDEFLEIFVTPMNVMSGDVYVDQNDDAPPKLNCQMNPLEQEFCPDLLNFLKAEVDKTDHRINQRSFMVIWNVQALLMNLRPFSFSQ